MGRFDWQRAIQNIANEVEGCLMAARDLPSSAGKLRADAARRASFAAWLARGYCRRGKKRAAVGQSNNQYRDSDGAPIDWDAMHDQAEANGMVQS